jgi:hypothetical protein
MGPDPENRVGDQVSGSPGRPVSSGLQVPGEPFPSWSGYGLISTLVRIVILKSTVASMCTTCLNIKILNYAQMFMRSV